MKRVLIFVVCLGMSVILICGCSGKDAAPAESQEATKTIVLEQPTTEKEVVEKKEPEEELLINLDGFTKGFEHAKFDKFNSPAKENGLGGTLVWMRGKFKKYVETEYEAGGETDKMSIIFLEDEDGIWMASFESRAFDTEFDRIKDLEGDEIIAKGVYKGFSEVYGKPAVFVSMFYDVDNGNTYSSSYVTTVYEEELGKSK